MSEIDFEIDVRSRDDGDFDVGVRSPTGVPIARMHAPFSADDLPHRMMALENALLRSAQPRRQAIPEIEQPVRQFGQDLFDALIAGEIHKAFYGTLGQAAVLGQPMRIKLNFDSPALSALPWEFLIDRGKDYLGLSARTPIVRSIASDEPSPPLTVASPLRMLAMVASPKGLPELGVDREKTRLEEATAKLRADGLLDLHWTTTGSYRELQDELQRSDWHIFHFAGHGGFNKALDTGFLVFVNETTGERDDVSANELARLLGDRPPRLAVLNACEGAANSAHDMFSSTAATLVKRRTPAVIAMQYDISDEAAKEFSRSFYSAIANGMAVDVAVAEARKSVSHNIAGTMEWGTPALFASEDVGVLFDLQRPTIVPPKRTWIERARAAITAAPVATAAVVLVAAGVVGAAALALSGGGPESSAAPSGLSAGGSGVVPPVASSTNGTPSTNPSGSVVVPLTATTLHIATELTASTEATGITNALRLALLDAHGQAGAWKVATDPASTLFDQGEPATGAEKMTTLVEQPSVVAVIGPYFSRVGLKQIRVSNDAGLLQCSASATSEELTLPGTRPNHQDRINFVRTITTNEFDGPVSARFVFEVLGQHDVFIIDDKVDTAIHRADLFAKAFADRGGLVLDRQSIPLDTNDFSTLVAIAKERGTQAFYFSGSSGVSPFAARLLRAIRTELPDALFFASGEVYGTSDSFLKGAAGSLANVYTSYEAVADYPGRADFEKAYVSNFGRATGLYSSTGYACARVILDAIGRVKDAPDLGALREAVRAAAVDPTVTYRSLIGDFHFDANGDTSQHIISFYQADPLAGTWKLLQALDGAG
jgi:ABC-type branched-subunit amino acid transport system substrate-binding protein